MEKVYYKTVGDSISPQKRKHYVELTRLYKESTRLVNFDTGEFRDFYPTVTLDRREKKREAKESNLNSYAHRFENIFGEDGYFYTVLGADIYPSWGEYHALFDRKRLDKFKNWVKRSIKGSFTGIFELSSYSGCHFHVMTGKQDSRISERYFKAGKPIGDYFGAVGYLSKPAISPKDKWTEDYDMMTGIYLESSLKQKELYGLGLTEYKRLPNRNIFRFGTGE